LILKIKQSHYRPGQVLRVPGVSGYQISTQWAHKGHPDIMKVFPPTDAQENCFKRSIKFYIKTAPTGFGVITIIRERSI
jgi:hypothetical protein